MPRPVFVAAFTVALAVASQASAAPEAARMLPPAWARCASADRAPAAPSAAIAALVGQYGSVEDYVDVYEACGRLFADGRGLAASPLREAGAGRYQASDKAGAPVDLQFEPGGRALVLGGERLARHDFGAEGQARIQAGVHADPDKLRAEALAAHPPAEAPSKRSSDLVSVPALDPTIKIHTLYAGSDNFLGVPIYERPGAFLQRPAAEALVRVSRTLRAEGYGLLITDAYRPWLATKMFWDATPPKDHIFVADPAQGSRHNRGCAVDITLYDLKTGEPVEMTGRVDEMSKRSYADYRGGTSRQRWLRDLLRREMEREGFAVIPFEWWHFDYKDWADYPIGTASYTELLEKRAR